MKLALCVCAALWVLRHCVIAIPSPSQLPCADIPQLELSIPSLKPLMCGSVHPFSLILCLLSFFFRKLHLQNYTGCHLWAWLPPLCLVSSGSTDVTEHVTSLSLFIICCIERSEYVCPHCWMTPGCYWRLYCAYWTYLFLFPFWALLTAFQNQTFLFSLCVFLLHNCLPWALHLGSHSEKRTRRSVPRP